MKIVIAEKPSVAQAIAKVIEANEKKNGYYEGDNYLVSWCVGHLVGLSNPEDYNQKYKKWRYEDLPILPKSWSYSVKKETKKQFMILENLMKREDVKSVIEATDAGREGELIFRLVYDQIGKKKPIERLWISSMEDHAIEDGFHNLKLGRDYENLYQSALARSKADWLVGINATRLFTTIYSNKLSVGRVQTPTLAMIAMRDEQIKSFQKEKFYQVELDLGKFKVKSEKTSSLEDINELVHFCKGKAAIIAEVSKEIKKNKPPLLFDLTTLQREGNRLFGYTAKQTLDYTQSLYEKKLVTYPRTDSRYITEDMEKTVREMINNIDSNILNPDLSRIINNSRVTDHHAIIPTKYSFQMNENEVPRNELNIYKLIQSKLIASISLDYIYEQLTIKACVDNREFKASGKTELEMGFVAVEDAFKVDRGIKVNSDNKKETKLPKIHKGATFNILDSNKLESFSAPPKYYTEDTLLSAMEKAGTEELDQSLNIEKKGLGTPATRASIIEKLISVGYIERKKKNLMASEKGIELINIVPENLKSAKTTAEWENKLVEISEGNRDVIEFMKSIEIEVDALVKAYSDHEVVNNFTTNKEIIGICPRCGAEVYEGNKNFYCSNKECEFSMWKKDKFFTNKKKTLTKSMATEMLGKGEVMVKKFYSDKKDKYYDAKVILDDTGKWVNYKLDFDRNNHLM
jgi:DNA topoisomerase-3